MKKKIRTAKKFDDLTNPKIKQNFVQGTFTI